MEKAIQLDNVSKHFGKKTVLTDINITIDKGQIYGFIGPSGAGKTTLVKKIVGMVQTCKRLDIWHRQMRYMRN